MSQRFSQQMPMQGQNHMPMQGPQMPVYNSQQMPVQGSFQQMNMQAPGMQMPMRGPMPTQLSRNQMPMQGLQNTMQMQGHGNQIPGHVRQPSVHMQGPQNPMPMQSTGQQMPVQGPRPMHSPNQQMPGQGQMHMQGQGQQMGLYRPVQGVPTVNPQMRGAGVDLSSQRMPQFAPTAPGQFGVRPPPYTPDMAKDFVTKQQILQREQRKLIEKQRKKMEEEFKQRQFQETQKRLKEFSAIGGRKMDVDMAISSIIGPTDSHPQPGPRYTGPTQGTHQVSYMTKTPPNPEAPSPSQEDDFADFMSCPVSAANQMGPHSEPANEKTDNNMTGQTEPVPSDKKDLVSMMFECSDLSAPKQAKSFKTKTSVKDVQPNVKVASFQQSNRSRQWSGDTEQLTELFTLPEQIQPANKDSSQPDSRDHVTPPRLPASVAGVGVPPNQPPGVAPVKGRGKASLPQWLTGEKPVPQVYVMVLEACTKEGQIDTSMLYPILLRSRLPKDLLGHLWSLCNKQTPGQLVRQELFLLLAMVTLAQNKMDVSSLDILLQCAEAPVPDLGQNSQPENSNSQGTTETPSQQGTMPTVSPATTEDDDFADFKSAAPTNVKPEQDETFGEFKSTPVSAGPLPTPDSKPLHKVGSDLIGEEDKYAALRISEDDTASADHVPSVEVHGMAEDSNFADFGMFKDSSSNSEVLSFSSPTSSNQESIFSSEDSSSSNQKSDDLSWGFPSASQKADDSWGFPSSNQKSDDKDWVYSTTEKTDDNKWNLQTPIQNKSKNIPSEDDFGDFADFRNNTSSTSFSSAMTSETPDKMSALKALVGEKKLYSERAKDLTKAEGQGPTSDIPNVPAHSMGNDDDWDPFVKSSDTRIPSVSVEDKSGFWGSMSDNREDSTHGMPGHKVTADTSSGEGWADFASAPVIKTEASTGSLKAAEKNVSETPTSTESRLKFDPKKANSLFSQNLTTRSSASTGLSALDTEPPDFPNSPELADNDDHGYDKFAAFKHVEFDSQNGVSSLAAPYGGFDEEDIQKSETPAASDTFGSAAAANQKPVNNIQIGNMKTSQSASSFEFSGWQSQSKGVLEDSQSMKSLDLPVAGSQDGSPAGVDSQSVSSLDFTMSDAKKTVNVDDKSVGSLDLKSEPQGPEADGSEEGFGEFSGATTQPEPVKPWTVGEAPINQADRYSQLMGEPRDSDRHLYCWDKCLAACVEILSQANDTFNAIDSLSVCREVVESAKGMEYLEGVTEVFRVGSRIRLAMHGLTMSSDDLEEHQKELHNLWNNLISFMANSAVMPSSQSLTFKKALIRKKEEENLSERLCGVCLLDADIYSDSESANQQSGHKLNYGGRQYHAPCANFWVNCVDSMLPALKIPDLL